VVRPVVELDPDVVDRVAGKDAAGERLLDPFVDRLDEFLRNRAADDFVLEDVTGSRGAGVDVNLGVAVLPAAGRVSVSL
jgi:hypothetical protein